VSLPFSLIFISTFLLFFLFAITQGASTQQWADLLVTVNTDVPTLSSWRTYCKILF